MIPQRRQMAQEFMKECSLSLISRVIKIKLAMRYHLTPVKMAYIKNPGNSAGEDVVKKIHSDYAHSTIISPNLHGKHLRLDSQKS